MAECTSSTGPLAPPNGMFPMSCTKGSTRLGRSRSLQQLVHPLQRQGGSPAERKKVACKVLVVT